MIITVTIQVTIKIESINQCIQMIKPPINRASGQSSQITLFLMQVTLALENLKEKLLAPILTVNWCN